MDRLAPLLDVRGISKSFGGAVVLDRVDFDLRQGEVHALVGENGAGKSTLMNIISGVMRPDAGEMHWDGRPAVWSGPRDAQNSGIRFVHQELALVPQLSVAENIFLGRYPARRGLVRFREVYRRSEQVLAELGQAIDPKRLVMQLSLAEQQLVEIARAVAFESRLIIMDEPTAPLDDHDAEAVFRTIRFLRGRGVGVIYISHRLKEIFAVSDRVTVLRDGKRILTQPACEVTQEDLVRAMIGNDLKERLTQPAAGYAQPEEVLRVKGAVRFTVNRGEIVGLAGLAGAGRTRLLQSLFGAGAARIEVCVNGRAMRLRSPVEAVGSGLGLVPDDRKAKGLVLGASVLENMALAGNRGRILIRRSEERQAVRQWMGRLRIKAAGLDRPVLNLSGGTQQKVVLAKWLVAGARIFLLDEPTRGIDVGAKAEIYDLIRQLARDGAAILMASSELEELTSLADRILVMHRGRITGELAGAAATEEAIMHLATGGVN